MSEHNGLRLGEQLDGAGARDGRAVEIAAPDLTTHGVILGMTGSGKTGLGIVLLEEALLRGIPALILDPKGDMGNLLLNFPALRPEDFRPWIDEAEATRAGLTPDAHAAATAERWQKGLQDWGVTADRMRTLGMKTRFTIYTPGSTAGVPLNVLGSLAAPPAGTAPEAVNDDIEGFVSGLLALVGRTADPLASPDHILLSNLIARAWAGGQSLDLATLVAQVANPPIRKLGVFELDTFMPPKERMALAVQLNALLASPSFAPWMSGTPLDVQRLLWDESGRPRAAVLYLAHLSEPERQFIVTLLLSRVVSWMRAQPGTSELRALIYMDEVAGFAPPTAQPPSKKPILTILKQARAHGVGMVLATQNPVDLDYKALSNAGTWLLGRLQTERDRARVLEGMRSADGGAAVDALADALGTLGSRQFLLHTARGGAPVRFTTRWAMSYLRGPLTRVEIERLMAEEPERTLAQPAGDVSAAAVPAAPATPAADELASAPKVASGVRACYADPAAPWLAELPERPARGVAAGVAARVHLKFDDTAAGVDHDETWECIFFPLTARPDPARALAVDYDERDLREQAPPAAVYALPEAPIDTAAFFRDLQKSLRDHLLRSRRLEVFANPELKLYARVGETRDEFTARCRQAAAERADAEAATLRDRYRQKLERLEGRQRTEEARVRELGVDKQQRLQQEVIAGAGQLLSVFLGGRGGLRSLGGAASRRSTTRRTAERLETAEDKLADTASELQQLEQELADELAQIGETWQARAERIEAKEIPLEQTDVRVDETVLVWIPAA